MSTFSCYGYNVDEGSGRLDHPPIWSLSGGRAPGLEQKLAFRQVNLCQLYDCLGLCCAVGCASSLRRITIRDSSAIQTETDRRANPRITSIKPLVDSEFLVQNNSVRAGLCI